MSSLAEQIAEVVRVALHNTIPAVGTRVYRARQDAIDRTECPAIVIESGNENTDNAEADGEVEANVLSLSVAIHVAPGTGAVWETAADELVVAAHALIRAATYPGMSGPPLRQGRTWEAASGDGSPGICVLTYRFDYWNNATDLSTSA